MSDKLSRLLATTLALSDQFQTTLSSPAPSQTDINKASGKDLGAAPLPLLSACSTALKSQVTKLSLLAINTPFTPSAVCSVLSAVNDSVLPSLVAGALLITDEAYTKSFRAEIQALAKTNLREFSALVEEVRNVAEKKGGDKTSGNKEEGLSAAEKDVVMAATSRVWDTCDVLGEISGKGVVGFVIRRVEEWRDLVKDAIGELEEWDPDEDEDFDDLLGEGGDDAEDESGSDEEGGTDGQYEDTVAMHTQKKTTLRILKPIAQIYPAIVSNRLKKGGLESYSSQKLLPSSHVHKLETLMSNLRSIPDHVDEAAGSLYEADTKKSALYVGKAKECAVDAIGLLSLPWVVGTTEGEKAAEPGEDKFTAWSKTWLNVIEEVARSLEDAETKKPSG